MIMNQPWSGSRRAIVNSTLPQAFEDRVNRTPNQIAIVFDELHLSYTQLNVKANYLANLLIRSGVEPKTPIAIQIERSIELVVAVLAVLKAGAIYVPLDPRLPLARVHWILDETRAQTLLTISNSKNLDKIKNIQTTIRVDVHLKKEDPDSPAIDTQPDDLAHIMYTSGSTGHPKGVAITHRAILEFVADRCWKNELQERVLFHSSLGFDISNYELWVPLLRSGQLVMAPSGPLDVSTLKQVIQKQSITSLFLTTSLFNLVTEENPRCLAGVQQVWIGGEQASVAAIQRMWDACPEITVVNGYGPTETTTYVTLYTIESRPQGNRVPIGRPMENTQVYVLDEELKPVPSGTPGEIYLAGTGLARGYFGQPSLTSTRFLANPFGLPGSRMYRTGDLGVWIDSDQLVCLGRSDRQVKIRGIRIEPSEIEAELRNHPEIGEAVVTVREDSPDEKRLIAYLIAKTIESQTQKIQGEQLVAWRQIYDSLYENDTSSPLGSDFSGWHSSYDGCPIPLEQMQEWQEMTLQEIRGLQPRRILEIGVGTGLLLAQLAPDCESYWGTDFSASLIERLRHRVALEPSLAGRVELRSQSADAIEGLPREHFDTVILNSVIQYFPNPTYLLDVLNKVVDLLVPGGYIFIGDIRNLRLLHCFHTEVQLRRTDLKTLNTLALQAAVEHSVVMEDELLVDPEFFSALGQRRSDIDYVDVRVKRGWHHNEMSQYRYNVILHKCSTTTEPIPTVEWHPIAWGSKFTTLEQLIDYLKQEIPSHLKLVNVPNCRVTPALKAIQQLNAGYDLDVVQDHLFSGDSAACNPEDFYKIGELLDYQVFVTWSNTDIGHLDILFCPQNSQLNNIRVFRTDSPLHNNQGVYDSLLFYMNSPSVSYHAGTFLESVRTHLSERLSQSMIPTAFVILDTFPLTVNGKVDRAALPVPHIGSTQNGRAPRNAVEERMCGLFAQILGVTQVTIDDNFFDLGGHSLSVMRLLSRIRSCFDVELAVANVFASPTVAELVKHLTKAEPGRPQLMGMNRPSVVPLSFSQQRLWFIYAFDTSSVIYNVPIAFELAGSINQIAMEMALHDVISRHDSLHTVFQEISGVPRQVLLNPGQFELTITHTSVTELDQKLLDSSQRPFDLSTEIPIRAELFVLGDDRCVLLILLHHITCDGWSFAPLWRDLSEAYATRSQGLIPDWTPLPVQYADYTLWQRRLLGQDIKPDSIITHQLDYWRKNLAELPELVSLPGDRPRSAVPSFRGALIPFRLSPELHHGAINLAQQQGTSLFMVLHAVLAVLLTRLGAGTDLPIGTPVANRTDDALEDLVGFFVNLLVLRTDTSGDPSFSDLLARIRDLDIAAYAHQDIPFELLVEKLRPVRSITHHPFFEILLALQSAPENQLKLSGVKISHKQVHLGTCRFDLVMNLDEHRHQDGTLLGIDGLVEYRTDLYDRKTIQTFIDRFLRLLTGAIADPQQRISRLNLLSPEEHHQLLIEWNDTDHSISPRPFPDLFEAQVAQTPTANALVFGALHLSYQELNARANQLAHQLIYQGIGPGQVIAIDVPRSPEWVIAVLAVLKAGAAYLPLDPSYPASRIIYMLEDVQPCLLITTTNSLISNPKLNIPKLQLDSFPWEASLNVTSEKQDYGLQANIEDNRGTQPLHVSDPAYIIYTSGSTGKPKGVVVTHAGISSMVATQIKYFEVTPESRILQFSSLSFDGVVWELCSALLTGATLVMAPSERVQPGPELIQLIGDYHVTHAVLPPAVLMVLSPDNIPSLTHLIVSGEAASGELVKRWSVGRCLINGYGPTETTVCATLSSPLSGNGIPPIGRAVINVQCYVLDDQLQLLPPGAIGELYISGPGLARGYLNQPQLTAERFLANPFRDIGSRMYRTGDLVRWRNHGELEFVGRADNQVKIRGFRVELGEVETALTNCPPVSDALAMVREDRPGEKFLVAYVVGQDSMDTDALRAQLVNDLPPYLIPGAIVTLKKFPLTVNGKIDRKALPVPKFTSIAEGRVPKTPTQIGLCTLFAELLGVDQVTIDDPFFALGGHSLLATQLVSQIRQRFGISLPVQTVFERQTVADLAIVVDREAPIVSTSIDLAAEVVLNPQIAPYQSRPVELDRNTHPASVLLTGATGFLGAYLLYELLKQTDANVFCLVRSNHSEAAYQRIHSTLKFYQLWSESWRSRIIPVCGDLSQPSLGLSAEEFSKLTELIDAIYHNGAQVSAIEPYTYLKPTNVLGTSELLDFAARCRVKPLHFVSTAAVAVSSKGNPDIIYENFRLGADSVLPSGYVSSKWVAEELVWVASDRGLPVTVHRPGRISGDTTTGIGNTDDTFWQIVRAIVVLGVVPDIVYQDDAGIDLMPVDRVASAIVHLSRHKQSISKVHHLTCPTIVKLDVVFNELSKLGYQLTTVSYSEWVKQLEQYVDQAPGGHSLASATVLSRTLPKLIELSQICFDQSNTLTGLAEAPFKFPCIDRHLVRGYLTYFINSKFFPQITYTGK
uniref:LtxA n=1 Tax=Lyngbya majuscula TaxID=158786 RepID=Q5V8A8_9CYAN|nr:LtxA [Lyngbya majuscula]